MNRFSPARLAAFALLLSSLAQPGAASPQAAADTIATGPPDFVLDFVSEFRGNVEPCG